MIYRTRGDNANHYTMDAIVSEIYNRKVVMVDNQWQPTENSIGGEMVSVLASTVVDRGFEPRSGQTKD